MYFFSVILKCLSRHLKPSGLGLPARFFWAVDLAISFACARVQGLPMSTPSRRRCRRIPDTGDESSTFAALDCEDQICTFFLPVEIFFQQMSVDQIPSCILESGLQILIFCPSRTPALRAKKRLLPSSGFPPRDKSWKPVVCLSGLWGGLASNYNATLNPLMKSRVQILSVNINSDEVALKLMSSRRRQI